MLLGLVLGQTRRRGHAGVATVRTDRSIPVDLAVTADVHPNDVAGLVVTQPTPNRLLRGVVVVGVALEVQLLVHLHRDVSLCPESSLLLRRGETKDVSPGRLGLVGRTSDVPVELLLVVDHPVGERVVPDVVLVLVPVDGEERHVVGADAHVDQVGSDGGGDLLLGQVSRERSGDRALDLPVDVVGELLVLLLVLDLESVEPLVLRLVAGLEGVEALVLLVVLRLDRSDGRSVLPLHVLLERGDLLVAVVVERVEVDVGDRRRPGEGRLDGVEDIELSGQDRGDHEHRQASTCSASAETGLDQPVDEDDRENQPLPDADVVAPVHRHREGEDDQCEAELLAHADQGDCESSHDRKDDE